MVEQWVVRHLGSIDHERRVRAIAERLFDLTQPLHQLGRETRGLLGLAALVHDVGRSIDDETHPREGARLLRQAKELPLSRGHRRTLVYLTRRHRGSVRRRRSDETKSHIDFRTLQILLALLRAADSLDSRAIESPSLVMAVRGRRLDITCYLDELTAKARKVYGRRKKFLLLEELLGCHITVKVARRKLRIYEVGISYWGRTYEEGKKIGWKDGVRALYCLLKYSSKEDKA